MLGKRERFFEGSEVAFFRKIGSIGHIVRRRQDFLGQLKKLVNHSYNLVHQLVVEMCMPGRDGNIDSEIP